MMALVILQAEAWSAALARVRDLLSGVESHALDAGIALIVMLAGWLVAALLRRVVGGVLAWMRFDQAMLQMRGPRGGRHSPARVAGWAVYWVVLACAAVVALDALGLRVGDSVSERLASVVPGIVTSAVLFVVGSLVAMLAGSLTRRLLETAEIRGAQLQGQVVAAVLTAFAALLALEQLGLAAQFVIALGIVAVGAVGLALALAFGLGCRDLARDFLVEYLRSLDDERASRPE